MHVVTRYPSMAFAVNTKLEDQKIGSPCRAQIKAFDLVSSNFESYAR